MLGLLLIVIVVLVLVTNVTPKAQRNREIQVNESNMLQMVVRGQRSLGIQEPPRLNIWEIPDERWEEPTYYSPNVRFRNGITTIDTPGVYRLKIDLNLAVINDSYEDVDADIGLRLIKGSIQHRFEYDVLDILCLNRISLNVPRRSKREIMITCDAIGEILPSDIADGTNSFSPQYEVSIPESVVSSLLDPFQIRFDRNLDQLTATIVLEKLI